MLKKTLAGAGAALMLLSVTAAAQTVVHPPLGSGVFAASVALDSASAEPQVNKHLLKTHEDYIAKHAFLRTFLELVVINRIQNAMNRYVVHPYPDNQQFVITWSTIEENLLNGFEWDDNHFIVNAFDHPFNGAMYYSTGRANGYDYFHSLLWAAVGSWGWEFAGENNHPAVNDWINTTYGGATFGETLYRLSTMILDNRDTGASRIFREIGAGILSPGRFLNRIVTGEAYHAHANPPGEEPEYLQGRLELGARFIGDEHLWEDTQSSAFIAFGARYGDAFKEELEKPFDEFAFDVQFNFDSPDSIDFVALVDAEGWLFGKNSYDENHLGSFVAGYTHYNYYSNEVYRYGSQEIGAGYVHRYAMGDRYRGLARVDLNAILLGASKTDYVNVSGRDYDYGPGLGIVLKWFLERGDDVILSVEQDANWIHSIDGNAANHYLFMTDARFQLPLHRNFKVGVEYLFYAAFRDYKDQPNVDVSSPEVRVSANFNLR